MTPHVHEVQTVDIEDDDDQEVHVEDIGSEWKKVTDPSIGQDYWYHKDTSETTWVMPPEWQNRLLQNKGVQEAMARKRGTSLLETIARENSEDFGGEFLPAQSFSKEYNFADTDEEEEESDFS